MGKATYERQYRPIPQSTSMDNRGLHGVYVGFVKDNTDIQRMGRLKVYIPDLGGDSTNPDYWHLVSYCSPFAGASPVANNVPNSQTMDGSQTSYGFWMIPPDVDNEVIVMFINGNPSKGIWMGCLYQQNMNHMVPGIANDLSFQTDNICEGFPPVVEYNKKDSKIATAENPTRPRFDPLNTSLANQGLQGDNQRGTTDASARREAPSHVFGYITPRGHHIYIDDGLIDVKKQTSGYNTPAYTYSQNLNANEYIRLRTRDGVQVLINDTNGYVYINSRDGNSWVEVSDEGVDVFSQLRVSLRSMIDINLHADQNINMYAGGDIRQYAVGNIRMHANESILMLADVNIYGVANQNLMYHSGQDTLVVATGNLRAQSGADLSLKSGQDLYLTVARNLDGSAGQDLYLTASQDINALAGNDFYETSTKDFYLDVGATLHSHTNSSDSTGKAAPKSPTYGLIQLAPFQDIPTVTFTDRQLIEPCYPPITRSTITTRTPTHEPWVDHPVSSSQNRSPDTGTNFQLNTPGYPNIVLGPAITNDRGNLILTQPGQNSITVPPKTSTVTTGSGVTKVINVPYTGAVDSSCGAPSIRDDVIQAILNSAGQTGTDIGYMFAIADIESSFNPTAHASTSSALGLYQFTTPTWNVMVNRYGTESSSNQTGIGPNDRPEPAASAIMGGLFTQQNVAALQNAGIDPNNSNLYLAHFMGAGGAIKFINADQNAPASSINPSAASANASIFNGRTVAQVRSYFASKVVPLSQRYGQCFATYVAETTPTSTQTGG